MGFESHLLHTRLQSEHLCRTYAKITMKKSFYLKRNNNKHRIRTFGAICESFTRTDNTINSPAIYLLLFFARKGLVLIDCSVRGRKMQGIYGFYCGQFVHLRLHAIDSGRLSYVRPQNYEFWINKILHRKAMGWSTRCVLHSKWPQRIEMILFFCFS